MEKGSNAPHQVSTLQLSPIYEMRVQGRLDHHWSTWFDGLAISYEGEDITVLRGWLGDEAALHGVLIKVREPIEASASSDPGSRQQEER